MHGSLERKNIKELFNSDYNLLSNDSFNTQTYTHRYVNIVQNEINSGKTPFGKILVIRDITDLKTSENK